MKNCDYCGRENADEAAHCGECGTGLPMAVASPPPLPEDPARAAAGRKILYGALWFIGGVFVTGVSYLGASGQGGGTYVVAWGAIVVGAIQLFRGWSDRDASTSVDGAAYRALDLATKLEIQGRIPEALEVYQKITERHPDSPAGRDARKSFESLKAKIG